MKNGTFARFYLLYGAEDYLRGSFKRQLKEALLAGGDEMNCSVFEGKRDSFTEVLDIAGTLPFFAERRVVIVENSGVFTSASELASELPSVPDSTVIVFVEKEADKRTKLYKFVKENGYVCEFTVPTPEEMKRYTAGYLGQAGKRISTDTCSYFVENCAPDMFALRNELDKLINYTGERNVVEMQDILDVCIVQVVGRIFDMTDAIAVGNRDRAIALYLDLLSLREKPMGILYLIRSHFLRLLGIKKMKNEHKSDEEIASTMKIPSWTIKKYNAQLKAFSYSKLKAAAEYATEVEADFKSGRIGEQLGVEIMIVKLSSL